MTYTINFPNLGIHLDHVPKNFSVFGFTIALYGVCIAIGIVVAFAVVDKQAKMHFAKPDDYFDLAIWSIIIAMICARIYYVIFQWDYYRGNFRSIINIREGGLAIYGGVIGGALTLLVVSLVKKINPLDSLDVFFPGVVIAQVIGRWGNFFNREAFSEYTDGLFAMQLPVDAVRVNEITETMWAHAAEIDGVVYVQVTPNFLYEGICNLCLFVILLLISKRRIFKGEVALVYVFGYGVARCYLEGLRTDQLTIGNTGLAVSQILGGVSAAVAAGIFVWQLIMWNKKGRPSPEIVKETSAPAADEAAKGESADNQIKTSSDSANDNNGSSDDQIKNS